MLFESKRLLELAGLPVEGASNVLTEGAAHDEEEGEEKAVSEGEKDASECDEEDKIRESVRAEIERMWASGEVFGTRASTKKGQLTLGFPGVGFKK
jgi:hypothetical protein